MTNTVAYWIDPRGNVIPVDTNHIDVVIRNPETFGLTKEDIEAKYAEYGERMGDEGKAREDIIIDLVKRGWIRIRRYRNRGWSVNVQRMSKKIKDFLFDWSVKITSPEGLFGLKERDMYMPVNIISFLDNIQKSHTLKEIMGSALYEKKECFDKTNVLTEKQLKSNIMVDWKKLI
jgi:hypothetical protein